MATLILQTAGAALGSSLGPAGSAIGRAAGALAGNVIDRSLFAEERIVEGSRLTDLSVQESREGSPIPRIFGRTRLSGQMIWATDFEEFVSEEEQGGGKGGGPSVTTRTFSYFANFAIALCEGEISHIARIWADGELLDTQGITFRVYNGSETQQPDSLISAKQGAGNAPAYRGTAYIVFERLPLEPYGNRLPQLSFEVVRSIGRLEKEVKAIQLIPGASEFLYDTSVTRERLNAGEFNAHNRHITYAATDMEASLDELQALCPNLEHVSIVSSWFGDDLRCGECQITPKVEVNFRNLLLDDWQVDGIRRFHAGVVSQINRGPAFGGTPSDAGMIRTIRNLKARGLKVTFNPFIMMDVPKNNGLLDPYLEREEQPVYPWRGRITSSIAPSLTGTTDKTANVRGEINTFLNRDFGYRRFILHAANLCRAAGGVDTFIIGSELRGLTWLRDNTGHHPFVEGLIALARDVRAILGANTIITYGADWSEYFGYHPQDNSGDVIFHLDPLWADDTIDVIGIDNYMPQSDWRDGEMHLDSDEALTGHHQDYLKANIAGGEGYDWFYDSEESRTQQIRAPITDGAYGKPWVFRYKDLVNWWSNKHFNRPNGVESDIATPWIPQSKPIVFTELGCPAIDKGTNQPNVFFDPRSSESAIPYFSSSVRDDAIQRASLEASYVYWQKEENNPASQHYGGPMVDMSRAYLWTWDARPYPAFPHFKEVWADYENWRFGHWLNGRLGGVPLAELIEDIVNTYSTQRVDVRDIHQVIDGYVISDRVSGRNALENLLETFQIDVREEKGLLKAKPRARNAEIVLTTEDFLTLENAPERRHQREQESELPSVLTLTYQDIDTDFRAVACSSRRLVGESRRVRALQLPIVTSYDRVLPVIEGWLQSLWLERERFAFALPQSRLDIEVGDIFAIEEEGQSKRFIVSQIDEGIERRIESRLVSGVQQVRNAAKSLGRVSSNTPALVSGSPLVEVLDLPLLRGDEQPHAPSLAIAAKPWPGGSPVFFSESETGFSLRQTLERPANLGTLLEPLRAGVLGVFDVANHLIIDIPNAHLSSVEDALLFSGRNVLAIKSLKGSWEILQFGEAELIGVNRWRLSRLLRAQAGTEDAMKAGFTVGTRIVLLNGAIESLDITRQEAERPFNLRVGLLGQDLTDEFTTSLSVNPKRRGLRPLSPVHFKAMRDETGNIHFKWIRRTRIDGDLWEVPDVPLGEESEAYELTIWHGLQKLRTLETFISEAIYSAVNQQIDFGALPEEIEASITQLSALEGAGIARHEKFQL